MDPFKVLLRLQAAAVDPDVEAEPEDRVPLCLAAVETVHHSPPVSQLRFTTSSPAVEEQRQAGGGAQLKFELEISLLHVLLAAGVLLGKRNGPPALLQ